MSQDIVQDSLEAPLGATAERQAVVSAAGATPGKDWVIVTRGIKREYDMGGEVVRALAASTSPSSATSTSRSWARRARASRRS